MNHLKLLSLMICLVMALAVSTVSFAAVPPAPKPKITDNYVAELEKLLVTNHTDYLDIKLTIDKLMFPDTDAEETRAEILDMVDDLNRLLGPSPTEQDKFLALRTYLYDAGDWNKFKPFSYDLDDPRGISPTSRALYYYLRNRKGNCVSMPILHAILGQKLGLDMDISTAPLHVFIKYTNETGETINIESTSGGYPARNEWYAEKLPMLVTAVDNGMFMKALSHNEAIAVMGHDLANHLMKTSLYKEAIVVSEKLLEVFPNYAPLHLTRGSSLFKLLENEFGSGSPDISTIADEDKARARQLIGQNVVSFKIAEELGWRDPDELKKEIETKQKMQSMLKGDDVMNPLGANGLPEDPFAFLPPEARPQNPTPFNPFSIHTPAQPQMRLTRPPPNPNGR